MPKVTGIVKITVDGVLLRSNEGASIDIGGYELEAKTGHKYYGESEKLKPSEIEFTLSHMADDDIVELGATRDVGVEFECDTGQTFLVTDASVVETLKLTAGSGEVAVKMRGNPAVKV